jgi:hypothetical protein
MASLLCVLTAGVPSPYPPRWTTVAGGCHPEPVTPPDDLYPPDLYPPRRPIFFPVVIATVFLTIMGMTVGFMLSERHRRGTGANAAQPDPSGYTTEPTPVPTGPLCPEQTQQQARQKNNADGDLHQVMRVETEKRTVVWICVDNAGRLYYQANRGGENAPWQEGVTALYLPDVSAVGDHKYVATAFDQTQFWVSREELRITHAVGDLAGRVEIQRVVAY